MHTSVSRNPTDGSISYNITLDARDGIVSELTLSSSSVNNTLIKFLHRHAEELIGLIPLFETCTITISSHEAE